MSHLIVVNENPYKLTGKFIPAKISQLEISMDHLTYKRNRHYYNDQLNNRDLFRVVFLKNKHYQWHAN